ncbi:MAG: efflux RND transporter permease subunit [Victivallaceae bacterium]|nr:efflux RND transporter permease subunit [Victivallaceae bacterium]
MFSDIFIERPRLAIVISLITVLAGLICMLGLPVAEYPEITPPTIMVTALYPGASSEVIAATIAAPIESKVNGVEDCIYFSSDSNNNGSYSLTLTFKSGTDRNIAQVNVQNAVERAKSSLPQEAVALGVDVTQRSSDILAFYSFSADPAKMNVLDLGNYVNMNVSDAVARISGVAQAEVMGGQDYSMRIWLDPLKMTALNVTPTDIASAVESQNVQAATGSVGIEHSSNQVQYKVNTLGRLTTAEEFGNIIVKVGSNGGQIRLRDVATVELGAENYDMEAFMNGRPCVGLAVYKDSDANAIEVVNAVNAFLDEKSKSFPDGVSYIMSYDPTDFIRATMSEIATTLVLTFILVVAITYLFLQDWRATLIPTLTIPVSIIGTFVFMAAMGYSINVLTMFALILVIGSVVDDAIVVVENTTRLIEEENLDSVAAAKKSMRQITGPVIATTLVTLAVYVPLAFYGGMVGTIYKQFAVTMCIALCLSTVNALTLSPALCSRLLRKAGKPGRLFSWFNVGLNFTRNGFISVSRILVRRALLTVLLFGGVLFLDYHYYRKLPGAFLPAEDKGAIMCAIQLPSGATLSRTDKVAKEVTEKVGTVPGVRQILAVAGFSFFGGNGENLGVGIVALDPWDLRQTPEKSIDAIQMEAMKRCAAIPSATVNFFQPPAIMGLGVSNDVTFMLQATGKQTAQDLAAALRALLVELNMSTPECQYAFSSYDASTPMLYLDLDRAKAEAMGVPISRIFTMLQSKLASSYINDFNLFGYNFKVKMQAKSQFRSSADDIGQLYVQNNSGVMVPLSSLAEVKRVVGPRVLTRFDQFVSAKVNASTKPGVATGELMNRIQEIVSTKLPKDYQVAWVDMSYQERGNEGKIVYLLALSLVFAYLFLVGQYESWTMPTSVILSVAVAIGGALCGLYFRDMDLSIYAQLGLVMLIGLSAKNAILIVEFASVERESGKSIEEAALSGGRVRYRAVLMTALSFVIGVFPMVVATGAGAGSRVAIGQSTFWGMMAATCVGIFFVPALFALFQRLREAVKGRLYGKK